MITIIPITNPLISQNIVPNPISSTNAEKTIAKITLRTPDRKLKVPSQNHDSPSALLNNPRTAIMIPTIPAIIARTSAIWYML